MRLGTVLLVAFVPSLPFVDAAIDHNKSRRGILPKVKTQYGTIVGSSAAGVDSFKGIPFALPPTGQRRLKPPVPITKSFGTINATGSPRSCPQFFVQAKSTMLPAKAAKLLGDTPFGRAAKASSSSEDCLTLNVQRPSSATRKSKLPVALWIYGGGFEFGSTNTYDATGIIRKSVKLKKDIIYVAMNYRVGGFGFLAGKELKQEGSTNLGLRDQRLAMEWVHDNIAAFGGDPARVTIWGESAGSVSTFDQLLINGGNNKYKGKRLFRGAIMDSGSLVPANPVDSEKPQAIYNMVVAAAGCGQATDTLACLRATPFAKFKRAVNSVPGILGYRSVDLSYLPRPDPSNNFFSASPDTVMTSRKFAKVPFIIGDQEDEGTLFALSQSNITTTGELVTYLKTFFPLATKKQVAALVATYPDKASAGSPFGTGLLYNIYPQYKRLAAILGDATFTLTRRGVLADVSADVPTWSYLASYFKGTPLLGTFHASDITQIYNPGVPTIPSTTIQEYYISFFNHLDPNKLGKKASPVLIKWPRWTKKNPKLVHFKQTGNSLIRDSFRQRSYKYLLAHVHVLRV